MYGSHSSFFCQFQGLLVHLFTRSVRPCCVPADHTQVRKYWEIHEQKQQRWQFLHLVIPLLRRFTNRQKRKREREERISKALENTKRLTNEQLQGTGPLFAGWPEEILISFINKLFCVAFDAGDYICHGGDVSDVLYVLTSGSVDVVIRAKNRCCSLSYQQGRPLGTGVFFLFFTKDNIRPSVSELGSMEVGTYLMARDGHRFADDGLQLLAGWLCGDSSGFTCLVDGKHTKVSEKVGYPSPPPPAPPGWLVTVDTARSICFMRSLCRLFFGLKDSPAYQ